MLRSYADERNAEVVSLWNAPDKSVINAGRRPAVTMPSDLFGPAWPLLQAIAEGTSAPVDYPALGLLSACASLMGGKHRVQPYKTSAWCEPPILWCGAVGDPSTRKSPALDMVTAPLREIERERADQHKTALRDWQERSEWSKAVKGDWQKRMATAIKSGNAAPEMPTDAVEPDEPSRRRTMVMDATPEAVGAILEGNPEGTLHFRDELAGWLTSFERYSPGGREFWLEAYGGRPFAIDRKNLTKGPLIIEFNGVSVLGGIQPAKLASALLASPDDGLVARFIWAWPDKVNRIQRPRTIADLGALARLYQRLEGLPWLTDENGKRKPRTLLLTDDAADLFEQWERENAEVDEDSSSLFKSFVGKMNGVVLRLALVAEYIEFGIGAGSTPSAVSAGKIAAAIAFVDRYAKPMAERVYGDAALPKVERDAAVLARYIRKCRLTSINTRELKQSPHKSNLSALRRAEDMDAAIALLVDADWHRFSPTRPGETSGNPRKDYLVNPAILEAA